MRIIRVLLLSLWLPVAYPAMQHGRMFMDETGMIMNANPDRLPSDCPQISEEVNLTVRAGSQHAAQLPGSMFAFEPRNWAVKGCAKINLTFINDDNIRHQLMIHGLPGYLYPDGMMHLELYGKGQLSASLIVPSRPKTYLVHCELPLHMEKGMKAQLQVAGGDGDLPSIPGLTGPARPDRYPLTWGRSAWLGLALAFALGLSPLAWLNRPSHD
ncbi:MAG: cupredoxin domain-containing protein [Methylococcales bacterium]|nr:cupredoxin domain-containing protein [Methylococcales bacterium]